MTTATRTKPTALMYNGMSRSKEEMATVLQNMIAAVQSKQEQIDKAVCRSVTIHSKSSARVTDGQPIPTMTIETSSGWSLSGKHR